MQILGVVINTEVYAGFCHVETSAMEVKPWHDVQNDVGFQLITFLVIWSKVTESQPFK